MTAPERKDIGPRDNEPNAPGRTVPASTLAYFDLLGNGLDAAGDLVERACHGVFHVLQMALIAALFLVIGSLGRRCAAFFML